MNRGQLPGLGRRITLTRHTWYTCTHEEILAPSGVRVDPKLTTQTSEYDTINIEAPYKCPICSDPATVVSSLRTDLEIPRVEADVLQRDDTVVPSEVASSPSQSVVRTSTVAAARQLNPTAQTYAPAITAGPDETTPDAHGQSLNTHGSIASVTGDSNIPNAYGSNTLNSQLFGQNIFNPNPFIPNFYGQSLPNTEWFNGSSFAPYSSNTYGLNFQRLGTRYSDQYRADTYSTNPYSAIETTVNPFSSAATTFGPYAYNANAFNATNFNSNALAVVATYGEAQPDPLASAPVGPAGWSSGRKMLHKQGYPCPEGNCNCHFHYGMPVACHKPVGSCDFARKCARKPVIYTNGCSSVRCKAATSSYYAKSPWTGAPRGWNDLHAKCIRAENPDRCPFHQGIEIKARRTLAG